MPELRDEKSISQGQLLALYDAVGWTAYTRNPPKLLRAVQNSTYVVSAWDGPTLIGLARCLSDDMAICYVQDLLVRPDYQRQGVGRSLLDACLRRFRHVRMTVLLTDDDARQRRFYRAMGFANTREMTDFTLNTFVRFGDAEERA